MTEATTAFRSLNAFINSNQIEAMADIIRSPEKNFIFEKLAELLQIIKTMPRTYETEGQYLKAVVHLHYFKNGCDWYITELDCEDEQLQAFGWTDLGFCAEMGYINLVELLKAGAELDLYWTAKQFNEVRK